MSISTKDNSDSGLGGVNIEDPHGHLELTEEELNEIYSRPYMNPDHGKLGCDPESNKILETE